MPTRLSGRNLALPLALNSSFATGSGPTCPDERGLGEGRTRSASSIPVRSASRRQGERMMAGFGMREMIHMPPTGAKILVWHTTASCLAAPGNSRRVAPSHPRGNAAVDELAPGRRLSESLRSRLASAVADSNPETYASDNRHSDRYHVRDPRRKTRRSWKVSPASSFPPTARSGVTHGYHLRWPEGEVYHPGTDLLRQTSAWVPSRQIQLSCVAGSRRPPPNGCGISRHPWFFLRPFLRIAVSAPRLLDALAGNWSRRIRCRRWSHSMTSRYFSTQCLAQ